MNPASSVSISGSTEGCVAAVRQHRALMRKGRSVTHGRESVCDLSCGVLGGQKGMYVRGPGAGGCSEVWSCGFRRVSARSDNLLMDTMGTDEIWSFKKISVTHRGLKNPIFQL